MKKYSSEQLNDMRFKLVESFEAIKDDSMNLNLVMEHIGLLSTIVHDMIYDELEERGYLDE